MGSFGEDGLVSLPAPPCAECAEPLQYDVEIRRFVCGNVQCSALGMEVPIWSALQQSGLAASDPPRLPRPVHKGLPVPWVVPRTADYVFWLALDGARCALAHSRWLCQVCGDELPEEAWVLATPEGQVLQAALHAKCKDLALEFCPHLSSGDTRAVPMLVSRDELLADGHPLRDAAPSDPFFLQQWQVTR
ncbi:hypothetical protein ACFC5T_17345 [Streptomyces sp. NPDC055961]|uniref:hypothetical protein n=1 Tax=Streptomyces sp. NPDC055961 TaxID=3345666 RepID=UPI0035E1B75B